MEPMNTSTPNSPMSTSPTQQYLPPYLMGDPQTFAVHSDAMSPKPNRFNVNFSAGTSNRNSPPDYSRYGGLSLFGNVTNTSMCNNNNTSTTSGTSNYAGNTTSGQLNTTQSGPPIQGLFDVMELERAKVNAQNQNRSELKSPTSPNSMYNTSTYHHQSQPGTPFKDSYAPNAPNNINASMHTFYSPPPTTTTMPSCRPSSSMPQPVGNTTAGGGDAENWATIFGFPPDSAPLVLRHFCGTIVDVVYAPYNGNWMHVCFSTRNERDSALNYNMKIIEGNMMIAVSRCIDRSITDKVNPNLASNWAAETADTHHPKLRSLNQDAFRGQREQQSAQQQNIPQRTNGLFEKAIDLFFGKR